MKSLMRRACAFVALGVPFSSASISSASKRGATPLSANMTSEPAQFFPQHSSQRVKIRYGPYSVVDMTTNNGMSTFEAGGVEMPCTDCLITWMQAGLEYANGTTANANTNLWLHHTVFTNLGRAAAVCPGGYGDEFFASGNERTAVDICVNGTDQAGYYLSPTDKLGMLTELMNMAMTPQDVILTVTWEFISSVPFGFDKVTPLWLDIGGCNGTSDQPAKSDGAFSYISPPWVSTISGRVTFMGAHLHDSGTHLEIKRNTTQECDCEAVYGGSPGYIGGAPMPTSAMASISSMTMTKRDSSMSMPMSMPMSTSTSTPSPSAAVDDTHISSISTCTNTGPISIGDIFSITAFYNGTSHALMTNTDGTLAPIMGIAILYVAGNNLTEIASNTTGGTSSATSSAGAASATGNATSGADAMVGRGLGVGVGVGAVLMGVFVGL